jgi:hypothetical protein
MTEEEVSIKKELFDVIKPLALTYESGKTYHLPHGARVVFEPDSFKAKFQLKNIEFYVIKAKPKYKVRDNGIVEVSLGRRRVYYFYDYLQDKAIVYYWKPNKKDCYYGHEQYKNILHSPAIVLDYYNLEELFFCRLGDAFFRPWKVPGWDEEIKQGTEIDKDSISIFRKITIIGGKIVKPPNRAYIFLVVPENEEAVLYHPEHGVIILRPGNYMIKRVSYSIRQKNKHD